MTIEFTQKELEMIEYALVEIVHKAGFKDLNKKLDYGTMNELRMRLTGILYAEKDKK